MRNRLKRLLGQPVRWERRPRTRRKPSLEPLKRRRLLAAEINIGVVRPGGGDLLQQLLDTQPLSGRTAGDENPEIAFDYGFNSTAPAAGTTGDDLAMAGDFSGIGFDQVVVARGLPGGALQWLADTDRDTTEEYLFRFGLDTFTPLIADMNGDGHDDIIAVLDTGARLDWYVHYWDPTGNPLTNGGAPTDYFSDSTLQVNAAFTFGDTGETPLAGDLNGDGRADITTVTEISSVWPTHFADAGANPYPATTTPSGIQQPTDQNQLFGEIGIPVLGDWDNDGDDNVGRIVEGAGTSQWRLNTDGFGTVNLVAEYGLSGDQYIVGQWPDHVWDGGGGNAFFSTASNWSNDTLPATGSDVVIDQPSAGPPAVLSADDTRTIGTLASESPVQVTTGTLTIADEVSSSQAISISGAAATLRLNGSINAASLNLTAGKLQVGIDNPIAATPFNISSGTIEAVGGTRTLSTDFSVSSLVVISGNEDLTLAGSINGTGGIDKLDANQLTLSSANTYDGLTTIDGGLVVLTGAGTLGSASSGTIINGTNTTLDAALELGFGVTNFDEVTLRDRRAAIVGNNSTQAGDVVLDANNSAQIRGPIEVSGNVSGSVVGTSEFQTIGGVVTLSGVNSYTAVTHIAGNSTLRIGSTTAIPLTSTVEVVDGTLDLNGNDISVGSLEAAGIGGVVALGSNTLSMGGDNQSLHYAGNITGSGNLFKTGTGTQTFSQASTFTGTTIISEGAILVVGLGTLGTPAGPTVVQNGGELQLGALTHNEPVTLEGGAVLRGDHASFQDANITVAGGVDVTISAFAPTDTMTINGNLVGGGFGTQVGIENGTIVLNGDNNTEGELLISGGTLILNGIQAEPVTVNASGRLGGTGTISSAVMAESTATIAPGNSPGILNTGDLDLQSGSTLEIELGGTVPGNSATNHDQINVAGTVSLAGTLDVQLFGGFDPVGGDTFVIINNDFGDTVSGTFDGLPEGAVVTDDTGRNYFISYLGGDGNDVVLTAMALTQVRVSAGNLNIFDADGNSDSLAVTTVGTSYVITEVNGNNLLTSIATASGNGTPTITVPFDEVSGTNLSFELGAGDDSITIGGAFAPGNLFGDATDQFLVLVDGQTGNDSIQWNGADTLNVLSLQAETITQSGNALTTAGQFWNGPVTLGANVNSSGSTVTYQSTLDGPFTFNGNANPITFQGAVGSITPLSGLTRFGLVNINGGSITTTGQQDYRNGIFLNSPTDITTITSTGGADIKFGQASSEFVRSQIDGEDGLVVNTTGQTIIASRIGNNSQRLSSFTTDAGGTTFTPIEFRTTGNITINDAVNLPNAVVTPIVSSGDVTFGSSVDRFGLSITTPGTVSFLGDVGTSVELDRASIISGSLAINGAFNVGSSGLIASITGAIAVDGNITASTTGPVSLTTERNVFLNAGSSIDVTDGNLTISGNQQPVTTTGDFRGIEAINSTIMSDGMGDITIQATGGDAADNEGIFLQGTSIRSTAVGTSAGTITIEGVSHSVGGEGAAVRFRNNALVESVDGDINIDGVADVHQGVFFLSLGGGTVRSTGVGDDAANISITGESLGGKSGFQVDPGTITGIDGDIEMTGISASGNGFLVDAGSISTTGTGPNAGKITLTGISGTGNGALFQQSFQVQTDAGEIVIVGTGDTGISARANVDIGTTGTLPNAGNITLLGTGATTDVFFDGVGPRLSTADGDLQIQADTLSLGTTIQGSGDLSIFPRTASTSIGLGGGAGTLNLSATEVGRITDGFNSITIGDATTGAVEIDTLAFQDDVSILGETISVAGLLTSTGDLTVSTGDTLTVNGTLATDYTAAADTILEGVGTITGTVVAPSDAVVSPGNSPGILNTGNFDLQGGATLEIELGGTSPGNTATDHDQVTVTGTVALDGFLDVLSFGGFTPTGGDTFVIINNDAADLVTGTFTGLSEGATVLDGSGNEYAISYVGGDGNDVVLTAATVTLPTLVSVIGGFLVIEDTAGNVDDLQITTSGSDYVVTSTNGNNLSTSIAGATGDGTPTITVPFAEVAGTDITIELGGQDDVVSFGPTFNPSNAGGDASTVFTIDFDGGGQVDQIFWDGGSSINGMSFLADALDVRGPLTVGAGGLFGTFTGQVSLSNDVTASASGSVNITTDRNIVLNPSSAVQTTDGNIFLSANRQAIATSGSFQGVDINNARIEVLGTGAIDIGGRGGDSGSLQSGIQLRNSAQIIGGTRDIVQIDGFGGTTSLSNNDGVLVDNASLITSSGADVSVSGVSGGFGSSSFNRGVHVRSNGRITAGGSGDVTVGGTATTDAIGDGNSGVFVTFDGIITSAGGDVTVVGTGGGSGSSVGNHGVFVEDLFNTDTAIISAGPTGSVLVNGTAGNATGMGSFNQGVFIAGAGATIKSVDRDVQIIAAGTDNSPAIALIADASIESGGGASIDLKTDSLELDAASTINSGSGDTRINPRTSGNTINFGGTDVFVGTRTLGLSAAELTNITAEVLRTGNTVSDFVVSAPVNIANTLTVNSRNILVSANLEVDDGLTLDSRTDLLITAAALVDADADSDGTGGLFIVALDGVGTAMNVAATDGTLLSGSAIDIFGSDVDLFRLLATAGNIDVVAENNANLNHFSSATGDFTVVADNDVRMPNGTHFSRVMDADSDGDGDGDLTIRADNDSNTVGNLIVDPAFNFQLTGANVFLQGSDVSLSRVASKTGDVVITATTFDVDFGNRVVTSAGDLAINAPTGEITQLAGGDVSAIGTIAFGQAGDLIVNGTIQSDYTVVTGTTLRGSGTIQNVIAPDLTTVAPGNSPGILNTGDFHLMSGATLEIELGGTSAGNTATDHDQVNVTGTVTLAGVLDVSLFDGFTPSPGDTFTIVNNDGADAIIGTFDGLAEGDTFSSDTYNYTISYVGGTDNNDVVLTATNRTFVVTNTNDSGSGSLRLAIQRANASAGRDEVSFDIDGVGPHTIAPLTDLPSITDALLIDGYTESGAATNTLLDGYNASLQIVLDGSASATVGASFGLTVLASDSAVRGIAFSNWGDGINGGSIVVGAAADSVTIAGNLIGTDVLGNSPAGGRFGIAVAGDNHVIGGSTVADRNVISGNTMGLFLSLGTGTRIQGNYIGINADGTTSLANTQDGINVGSGISDLTIGGTIESERNLISGNAATGIAVTIGSGIDIIGNYIGTDSTGEFAVGNGTGVSVAAITSNVVVGTDGDATNDALEGNLISGNGIGIDAIGAVIAGNLVGTDHSGLQAIGNTNVAVLAGAGTRVGTDGDGVSDALERNVVSGNVGPGVVGIQANASGAKIAGNLVGLGIDGETPVGNAIGIRISGDTTLVGSDFDLTSDNLEANVVSSNTLYGVQILGSGAINNLIVGNLIGTDVSGTLPRGNTAAGVIHHSDAGEAIIGANVIADNDVGIIVDQTGAGVTVEIQGNWIGTDTSSSIDLGNASSGVSIDGQADSQVIIGGIDPGRGNVVAFNDVGVSVSGDATTATIRGNSIIDNDAIGIDLIAIGNALDGVTPNDGPGDSDAGGNRLQNFPDISIALAGANTEVTGVFGGSAGVTYQLDFYASDTADPSGFGEGGRYLGSLDVVGTGASTSFAVTTLEATIDGEVVTATATRNGAETSEFSAAVTAIDVNGPAILPGSLIVTVVPDTNQDIDETPLGLPVGSVQEGQTVSLTGIWASPGSNKSITINWGDGTSTDSTVDPVEITPIGFSVQHVYADDSPSGTSADDYEIGVIVTDNTSGGSGRSTRMIRVENVPAQFAGTLDITPATVVEGATVFLTGAIDDPGVGEEHELLIDWGDQKSPQLFVVPFGDNTFSVPHLYANDSNGPISVTLYDDDSGTAVATTQASVFNAPPTAVLDGPTVAEESTTVTFTARSTDVGIDDELTHTWQILDGGRAIRGFEGESFSVTFHDQQSLVVQLTTRDGDGGVSTVAQSLEIVNSDPKINVSTLTLVDPNGSPVNEGDTITFRGEFFDAGRFDQHFVMIDWGDGTVTPEQFLDETLSNFSFTHRYIDDDPTATPADNYNVTISVRDEDGGSDSITQVVTVNNVAPSVRITTRDFTTTQLTLASVVVDSPNDTLSYAWTVNGAIPVGVVVDQPTLQLNPSDFSGETIVQLTVTDDDGGETTRRAGLILGTVNSDVITIAPAPSAPASDTEVVVVTGTSVESVVYNNVDSIVIAAAESDDTIVTDPAVNVDLAIDGGDGEDTITTSSGDDLVDGGGGNDMIRTGSGNDILVSDSGDDVLDGGLGDDTTRIGGFSVKTLIDEGGTDTIDFSAVPASGIPDEGVTLDLSMDAGESQIVRSDGEISLTGTFENVTGTSFRDTIAGNDEDNLLFGGAGDDTLGGGDGNDMVYGGDGDDDLIGSEGNDMIFGGAGDDTVTGGDGNEMVFGGAGDDTIIGSEGNDMIFGGPGDDTVTGGDGNAMVFGGGGVDTLDGGAGNDMIFGGAGDDILTGGDGNDFVYGGEGDDEIDGSAGNDMIFGGPGDDTVTGGDGNEMIYGGAGDDTIIGSDGNDMIFGGAGDDTVTGGDGNAAVYGGAGIDVIDGGAGNDIIFGGAGDDTLTGGDGNDFVYGGGGDDTIDGSAGNDMIFGGPGDDTVVGGDGNEMIYGGDGDDTIIGSEGNDMIFGGPGDDTVTGGDGNSAVYGGEGNDDLDGGAGNDLIFGGSGDDTLTGGDGNDFVYGGDGDDEINGSAGNDMIFGGGGDDTVTGGDGNEMIYGGTGDDWISGGDGNDMIFGGAGDDMLTGGDGNDAVYGDSGDDEITGSAGNDMIFGGAGDDTVTGGDGNEMVYGGSGDDWISGGDGNDMIFGGAGDDTLTGGDGNDMVYGNADDDWIVGSDGNDMIFGGAGDDTVTGGDGNEMVYGGSGDDWISGGDGNDMIFGGNGADTLSGGVGDDVVRGNAGDDTITGSSGNDMIFGGAGNDSITAGIGHEIIHGDSGNDSIVADVGEDLIFGDAGQDTVLVTTALINSNVLVTISGGNASGPDIDPDRLIALTNADLTLTDTSVRIGTNGNIVFSDIQNARLVGSPANNVLDASAFSGDVTLVGGSGDDTLAGGIGNDHIDGGDGDNQLIGGPGNDRYVFDADHSGNNTLLEQAGGGIDRLDFALLATPLAIDMNVSGEQNVSTGLSITLVEPQHFDEIIGTPADDTIRGNAGDNLIVGLGGLDLLDGRAGNDTIQAGGQRIVLLDFDSETDASDHFYTPQEREMILERMRTDFELFDVSIDLLTGTTEIPALPFLTVIFNAGLVAAGDTIVGGRSQRIGFRELGIGGQVSVNANSFLRPDAQSPGPADPEDNRLNGTPENYIALSSTIASHELAHTFGVRHIDAYGPIGSGVFAGSANKGLLPIVNVPRGADQTSSHLSASPNAVGTELIAAFGDPYFGYREATKLAFAENGRTVAESTAAKIADPMFSHPVQPIGELTTVVVPDTINLTLDAPSFSAINIAGRIDQPAVGDTSESDFYSFVGVPGDLLTIEVLSETLRHRVDRVVDTVVRVYGPDGNKIEYHGDSVYGGFNDNAYETLDALLFDFRLPVRADGTTNPQSYTIEVDTFSFDLPELHIPGTASYLGNFNDVAFCAASPTHPACADTDYGEYELLVYRFDGVVTTPTNVGDTIIGGLGRDKILGNSGNETIFGFNPTAGDTFDDPSGPATFLGDGPMIDPVQTMHSLTEGSTLTLDFSAGDADSTELTWALEPVPGQLFPTGATIRSTGPLTATLDFTAPDNGSFMVRIVASDTGGLTDFVDVAIQAVNDDPTAMINVVSATRIENTEIVVTATATDPAGSNDTLTYHYSVFKNGSVDEYATDEGIDATEFRFTPDDNGNYEIRLTVTDEDGGTSSPVTQTVIVGNVAPSIDTINVTPPIDGFISLTAEVSDASPVDILSAEIDWGDGNVETVSILGNLITSDHTYRTAGNFNVKLTLSDDDGGVVMSTVAVTVNAGSHTLLIEGTAYNDYVYVFPWGGYYRVYSNFDGIRSYPVADIDELIIDVGDGNDYVLASYFLFDPVTVFGGNGRDTISGGAGDDTLYGGPGRDLIYGNRGNDLIFGGADNDRIWAGSGNDRVRGGGGNDAIWGDDGNDVLLGNDGDDRLFGRSGQNILIGGLGSDRLSGQQGDDILIGAFTSHDNNDAALDEIAAEWTSGRSYVDRVNNLRDGTSAFGDRNNGSTFLQAGVTVFDDGAKDHLQGGRGYDWYFALDDDEDEDRLIGARFYETVELLFRDD
tara:strand:+ start:3222 stop:21794 length:18573 start_codon:yes stop_codon:yes gene_type:complete